MTPWVTFQPSGKRAPASTDETLWELAIRAGVDLLSTCGGRGTCGKCQVVLQEKHLGRKDDRPAHLACQTRLPQGGTVWIPEQSRPASQVIMTSGLRVHFNLNSRLRAFPVRVAESPDRNLSSWEDDLQESIKAEVGHEVEAPLSILRELPGVLKQSGRLVTVTLAQDEEIVGIQPGDSGRCLGVSLDLGTTTVVAFLVDLLTGEVLAIASEVNPQISRGDDVISRISYVTGTKDAGREMAGMAVRCVDTLIERVCQEAGVSRLEIYECLLVGNTAMHHIFLELDTQTLVRAPFASVVNHEVRIKARDVGLPVAPEAWLSWLPVKAGFVGADTIAVLVAIDPETLEHPTLIVDLGTNGEMVLAVEGQLICCSTAAGPALEGGHVSWGMRGAPGAVEKVYLHPETLEPTLHVINDEYPQGLCGSGLVSLVSQLVLNGVLTSTGAFDTSLESPRLRQGEDGDEFVVAFAGESAHGSDIVLTARDVAELQMAKAAIRAGSEVLCQHMGLSQVEKVILTGAFGNYLDPIEALQLGMFPDVPSSCIEGAGNAAATGALKALVDSGAREEASRLARDMAYLELSGHPKFRDAYVDFMPFPEPVEQI